MPELPEMENYRTLLSEEILDLLITGVVINRDKTINTEPDLFINELTGNRIIFVERRAKHLIFHLANGKRLVLHLMLGGMIFWGTEEERLIVPHKWKFSLAITFYSLSDCAWVIYICLLRKKPKRRCLILDLNL